ncbi:MAG: DNA phosphorothioation-dependent restriction protein DptH [Clostridium sp.]
MSKQFYKYIASSIVTFFEKRKIKPGDKFSIQFDKDEVVNNLYEAIREDGSSSEFKYVTESGAVYNTYALNVGDTELVVARTDASTTEDFLLRLRNLVGVDEVEKFKDCGILFIYNTTLDSLVKGTESLQKEGMPLHVNSIAKKIKKELDNSTMKKEDKYIVNHYIDSMEESIAEDNSSIFEYESILDVLYKKSIDNEQYKDFGLFYDDNLGQYDEKQVKGRLADNSKLFQKVDIMHKYGNPEAELEKDFDQKGVDFLKGEDWKDCCYKEVKLSQERMGSTKVEFIEAKVVGINDYWIRNYGETKAQSRKKNILIFNDSLKDNIRFEVKFSDDVSRAAFKVNKKAEKVTNIKTLKNKVMVDIDVDISNMNFINITYNDTLVKYEFKICIVNCQSNILEEFARTFTVNIKTNTEMLLLNTDNNNIVLNPKGSEEVVYTVRETTYNIDMEWDQKVIINYDVELDDDTEFILTNIKYKQQTITIAKQESKDVPTVITGQSVAKRKREERTNYRYLGENKIVNDTSEYYAKEDFKKNLEIEKNIIDNYVIHGQLEDEDLISVDIDVDNSVKKAYEDLVDYFRVHDLLPSLAYYSSELESIAKKYVESIVSYINNIDNLEVLSRQQQDIAKIGVIYKTDGDKEIMLTPLHPINIAYQLHLNSVISDEVVDDVILKLLGGKYLLPYICKGKDELYKVVDQKHSPEWSYYVNHNVNRYRGSKEYVSKLVREKVSEFTDHFGYLFRAKSNSKINLKLINLGDCKEVVCGIFDYYTKILDKTKSVDELIALDVYIYGDKNTVNAFEEISFYNSIEDIKEHFNVNLKCKDFSEEDVLNVYRDKVNFYKLSKNESEYVYSHLTFYEMDQDVSVTSSEMGEIVTGMSLEGILSGVPSVFMKESYRTGFGSKFAPECDLVNLAKRYNSINKSIGTNDPYDSRLCVTTCIGESNKEILDRVYDSSHWVTFIDPKVDLNFFKNRDDSDLLIIHYSDQYTSSSGYDAITVTRRSSQYKVIVEEFLASKNIETNDSMVKILVNYFNAVNGDWLLRLISSKSQFPREKLSILSAIKVALSYYYHRDIIWVPVSLEEILRVSGGAGLKKSDGLFSVKNLTGRTDSYSDDILLVGIESNEGDIKVHYYPIEVKIGENSSTVIEKAIEQSKRTSGLLYNNLIYNSPETNRFRKKMYRNFMMQLVIVSAEKMKLYNVWDNQDWDKVLNTNIREKLLNDRYEIVKDTVEHIGEGAVISFRKGTIFKSNKMEQNINILEFTEQDGYKFITRDIDELKKDFVSGKLDIDETLMLSNNYKNMYKYDESNREEDIVSESTIPNESSKENYQVLDSEEKAVGLDEKDDDKEASIISEEEKRPMKINFGTRKDNDRELYWYPTDTNQVLHTNTGIIGTMGTGKTQFTKSLITQMYREQCNNVDGKKLGMLIFDYKGDYIDYEFVNATNASVYELYQLPYNPLALDVNEESRPLLPLHTANVLKETIAKAFNLGIKQETLLRDVIMEAYERRGILKSDRSTWNRLAPTINDVCSIYFDREDVKEDSLYAALKNLYEFEIFEPDPTKTKGLFNIVDGVTVIKLNGYDEDIQNLVVAITLDIFYTQMLINGESKLDGAFRQLNKMILVDEADNFLCKNFISIKKILKEGRMFGVGTILSTQLLSHFATTENEYQNYILTWIVHKVSDLTNRDVRFIFSTKTKVEEETLFNKIKSLDKHESLVKIPKEDSSIHIKDKAFWELNK